MGLPAQKKNERYTYKDYLTWPEQERWEIIDGIAFDTTPAPSFNHQKILVELLRQFATYLLDRQCVALVAPFDVRIPLHDGHDDDIDVIVQPDLVVVCDRKKLDEKGCKGAPDLIVEILSPHTASKDMKEKFNLYERAGVKEYWIVHPAEKILEIFSLDEHARYGRPERYADQDKASVGLFEGDLVMDLGLVFRD
jgi:Uma2 family endonuclease